MPAAMVAGGQGRSEVDGGCKSLQLAAQRQTLSWAGAVVQREGGGKISHNPESSFSHISRWLPAQHEGVEATAEFMHDGCEYRGEGR